MNFKELDLFGNVSWTTAAGIERDISRTVPRWLLSHTTIKEESDRHWFGVVVKLFPWAWIGFGYFHRKYQRILQERCDMFRPAGTIAKIVVK